MPRKISPLSDAAIRTRKPGQLTVTLYDGEGLQLRISPHGNRSWIFNYVPPHHSGRTNIKLGTYPSMGLAQARELKLQYRQLVSSKIDPQRWLEKQNSAASINAQNTLQQVFEKWFLIKSSTISARYASKIQGSFKLHLLPKIGHLPLSELTAPHVIEILRPLEKAKKLETLSRLCQFINQLMVWATNTGVLQFNLLNGIKSAFLSPKSNRMRTIEPAELPAVMQQLNNTNIDVVARGLFEWQLHTMVRPGEAVKTRWQDIDFANSIWNIPAEFMKKRRPHQVPLSKQCMDILELMQQLGNNEFVFPGHYDKRKHRSSCSVNNVIKAIGFNTKLVAHGMRSLASTVLNEHAFNSDWVEQALSHTDKNTIRAIYNNATYLDHRRTMMNWWSGYIQTAAKSMLSPQRFNLSALIM
ncbi:hypothetical protein VT06_16130 [Arsukibacterium sp. MJ3]|uniref:tyrosine-type recombinase/integrase n=1 Tax=Arsukibacterium sp. MJ3 TaxID=1632859 RepID=UPI0006273BDD|nr:tyrosine-type recombinase/integrase [Arsukibacterium sp. MJ3]KKO47613.1 hypothetical protein VT06_16130 [Arsukibacterium sp. MJ3]